MIRDAVRQGAGPRKMLNTPVGQGHAQPTSMSSVKKLSLLAAIDVAEHDAVKAKSGDCVKVTVDRIEGHTFRLPHKQRLHVARHRQHIGRIQMFRRSG